MKPTLFDFLRALRITEVYPRGGALAQIKTQEGWAILVARQGDDTAPIPFGIFEALR
jgi:hypothetical protein